MKRSLTKVSLAPLFAVFVLGCQEQGSGPVGPGGLGPQFAKVKNCDPEKGKIRPTCEGGDDGTEVTWSFADHSPHEVPQGSLSYTLHSSCSGTPAPKTSNPTVEWKDGEGPEDGCVTVTTKDGFKLTNDAHLIVATKKGATKVTLQFLIQDIGGADGIQYRTDRFSIDSPEFFDGAGFTLHVHSTVPIWRLKGHTGGPKVENAGRIHISDIVYR